MFGRSRSFAVGVVVAVLVAGGGLLTASAAGSSKASSFVPITPCRLFDTRSGVDNIGSRSTPIGAGETYVVPVWGTNGNCTIPAGATGVSISVAIINPTASSYLTVFPPDAPRPFTSNLNWVAGQAPTPNAVTAPLSADGRMGLYNLAGTVDLLVDIVGYYELATSGPAGPQGPPGAKGDTGEKGDIGDAGPRPAHVVWVAKSGGDFTSVSAALTGIGTTLPAATATDPYLIKIAPGTYDEAAGIDLEANVSVEGSGIGVTILRASGPTVIRGAGSLNNVEVRNLSVRNLGAVASALWSALSLSGVTGVFTVRDAAFDVANHPGSTFVILAESSNINLVNTTATSGSGSDTGYGLSSTGSSVVRVDGGAFASNGAIRAADTSSVFITGSQLGGFPVSLVVANSGKIVAVASTVTGKKFLSGTGTVNCVASFDSNLVALADCPV